MGVATTPPIAVMARSKADVGPRHFPRVLHLEFTKDADVAEEQDRISTTSIVTTPLSFCCNSLGRKVGVGKADDLFKIRLVHLAQ